MTSKPRAWPSLRIDNDSTPCSSASSSAASRIRSRLRGRRGSVCKALDRSYGVCFPYTISLHRTKESAMGETAAAGVDHVETIRAAVRRRWGAPEDVVEITQVPKPALSDDGVLVRVRAASINRTDYYDVAPPGLVVRPMIGGFFRPKRHALGGDFAGVVEAVGKDLTGFAPGDAVFGSRTGAFGEYVCARMVVHK